MNKVLKKIGMLTLAGVLAIENPIATIPGLTGSESTITIHAAGKYDSFSDIVSAIQWGAGFISDAKKMYKNKSKVNHVYNVSNIAYYYYTSNQDIGKAIDRMVENKAMLPVDLGLDKKSSKGEIKKTVTAYLIGCLGEYQYIQESGILSGIIHPMEKTKKLGYAFVYTGDYFKSHASYARKHTPYEYMATHIEWARKAAQSAQGTGYLDKQTFKEINTIVKNAIEFLY